MKTPLVAMGWLYWKPRCMKYYTASAKEAFQRANDGFIVHRVEIRSINQIHSSESKPNPKGVCLDCGKAMKNPDANLCLDCCRKRWPDSPNCRLPHDSE